MFLLLVQIYDILTKKVKQKGFRMYRSTFEKARTFIYRNARPLDLTRFQYHFENGNKENVLNALMYYQNEDGGCGHAVEPDCLNPNSIALHSNTAGDIVREIEFYDASHPFIQGLLKYYSSGIEFDGHHWNIAPKSNNDYPRAPWWHTDCDSSCHADYNGTAQIAGFIICFAEKDSEVFQLGVRIANEAIDALSADELIDMHTCSCYLRMLEFIEKGNATDVIPYTILKEKLHKSINKLITKDKTAWGGYVCKPSRFMSSKDSEYYEDNKEIADFECEFIANTQLEDGSWPIPWNWEDYPEEWAVSKNWWKSIVIIENLLYLKGFQLI